MFRKKGTKLEKSLMATGVDLDFNLGKCLLSKMIEHGMGNENIEIEVNQVYEFEIYSSELDKAGNETEWVKHVTGKIFKAIDRKDVSKTDLKKLRSEYKNEMDAGSFYVQTRADGIEYEEHFSLIKEIYVNSKSVIADIEASEEIKDQFKEYNFHPVLLDACLHTSFAPLLGQMNPELIYLPIGINSVNIFAKPESKLVSHLEYDSLETDKSILNADLKVYTEDGRYMLNHLDKLYSVVAVDAYRPPYIPWHLTTVEFFQEVRAHLNDNGVVAINVGRTDTDRRLVDAMTSTLLQVFPSVHAMDVPLSFNTILVATLQPTTDENLAENLSALPPDSNPFLIDSLSWGVKQLTPIHTSDTIFTDDRAPVETLADSLVLNFLLSGDADQISNQP